MRPEAPAVESPTVRPRRPGSHPRPDRKDRRRRVALEGLEPRTLMAVLPPATVTGQIDISASPTNGHETAPSIAIDPVSPQKLVAVWTHDTPNANINGGQTSVFVEGAYSTNAGQTWTSLPGTLGNARTDFDQVQTSGARFFAQVTDAGVAFDGNNQFYILSSPHSGDYGAGELLLQKFDFSGSAPTQILTNQPIYRWTQDPAFRPVLAVDSNLASFTDPANPGYIQADPFAGNVYVAWGTNNDVTGVNNANANVIKIVASSDAAGATAANPPTFTTQQYVNDGGNFGGERDATPRLAISQGRPIDTAVYGVADQGVPGGQVTVVWDDSGTLSTANPARDRIVSDRFRDGGVGAVVAGTTGPIAEATDPGGGAAHIPAPNPANPLDTRNQFTADVAITDPEFLSLSDLDVTVDLTHNSLSEIRIELIPPPTSGLPTITLLNNRTNGAGTANTNTGAAGANLGTTTAGITLGTVFDDDAPRSIFNNAGGVASTGHFRPEFGSLSAYDGATAATLNGTWTLRITDFRASGTPNPAPRLNGWSLNFTSGLNDGVDTVVATTLVRGAVAAGAAPLRPAAAPDLGIAPAPVVASDNTLGAFSPHQGRLYVAYVARPAGTGVPADNTDIALATSDDGGLTWQATSTRVNDDLGAVDGFSESDFSSGRPQFLPAAAVDPATGTLVVTFLDARDDAARARVATYLAASIDGGATFGPQTFVNAAETAADAITGAVRVRGPLPENQSSGNATRSPFGFGHRQDVAVANGRVYPAWAGNNNGGADGARRLDIFTAAVAVAAGPRVVGSTMGPVGEPGDALNVTRAADGTPQVSNVLVGFDRPIDPATFSAADVRLVYRNPAGVTTDLTATAGITVTPVPGPGPNNNGRFGFTTFNVGFTPQSGVGTYSYSIGPNVSDRIRATVLGLGTPQSFTSTNATPARVPAQFTGGTGTANDTTTSSLFVFGHPNQVISGLTVGLNLTHTRDGDLTIRLRAPDGTLVTLYQKPTDAGQNFVGTVFSDAAAQTIAAGTAPYAGSFRPVTPLSALAGSLADGFYQLIITDGAGNNIGQLNGWSLTFNTLTPGTVSQAGAAMDQDADATAAEPVDDAYATPRPLAGGSPTAGPFDPDTLPLIVTGPHVVGTTVPSATTPSPVQFNATSTQVNRPIPDATAAGAGVLTATIDVVGLPRAVADLDVRVAISHPSDGDLILQLIAPNGTVINLAGNLGGGGGDYDRTVFDDQAAGAITSGSPPFGGSFRPQGSLGQLNGLNPNGTWTLRVSDTVAGNTGTLTDFTLTIVTANAATSDNLVLNDTVRAIDVTFDRDMDPASFTPNSILRVMGPAGVIVPAAGEAFTFAPAAAGNLRTFRIGFPPSAVQALSGTYTVRFGPGLRDARGNALDQNLNAGVDVLFNRGAATAPLVVPAVDTPLAIPDATAAAPGVLVSTIVVGDDFPIPALVTVPGLVDPATGLPGQVGGITVQVNIQHPGDPDLQATLIYHPGQADEVRIPLFGVAAPAGAGGNQANFTNTVFDDAATTPIQGGVPPFFGRFNPEQPLLTALAGRSSAGAYALEIRDVNPTRAGALLGWSLSFRRPLPNTGLGELVTDEASASFRIFTTDPTDRLASSTWTALGPASINGNGNSGRIGGIAVDPSDPSGNTVFIGGASGGVWKTTNFLTTDPSGPVYIPLTDFGPAFSLNIGGIAVFPRNNDPNQSIVFAATGEGDTGSPGVGFLRSADGGATWTLLDSTDNTLPFAQRDHRFAQGTTAFKVVVDPRLSPTGDVIVYAALSGSDAHNGIWRSLDTGRTWQRLLAGRATDVLLDPNSGTGVLGGNLQVVYAAVAGLGVFSSPNRGQTFNLVAGGVGNPLIRDADRTSAQVNPVAPSATPNGAKGRIVLAKPSLTGDAAQDLVYQGWLYAAVITADSHFDGLYLTKDFGQNWTRLRIPTLAPVVTGGVAGVRAVPTNDLGQPDYDIGGGPAGTGLPAQGNYDVSLGIDPTNPNVVYLGGTADGQPTGFIRIDATLAADAHALVAFQDNRPDGGLTRVASNGGAGNTAPPLTLDDPINLPSPRVVGDPTQRQYYNLIRDPSAPFVAGATVVVRNSLRFNNTGGDVRWMPFDFGVTDQHRIVTFVDPVTGHARLIIGDDQGVHTAVDDDGAFVTAVGTRAVPFGARSGNLQVTQFYYGAAQPSSHLLNGQIRALLYGQAQDDGFPRSDPDILNDGNLTWAGGLGDGAGVATDPQGLGTLYQYNWPCCGGNRTDFFQVDGVGRTFGLLQQSLPGPTPDPQWPNLGGSNFAVNPLSGNQIIMSSPVSGRFFRTENRGLIWTVIGEPAVLDGTYVQAPAFGAPDPFGPGGIGNLDNLLYAGTVGGRIFVSQTGGGGWTNISAGLDGSALQAIVTNPTRGSHEAYAVTSGGVFYNPNTVSVAGGPFAGPAATWQNITGNLFAILRNSFGDAALAQTLARNLTSIAADWRYVVPNAAGAGAGTHPLLYVSSQAGVYRSLDNGASWSLFPDVAFDGAPQDGGLLPSADVRDLDLSLGNIDPTTGRAVAQPGDPNLLVATTFGRGTFGIRLAPVVFPNTATQPNILGIAPADQLGGNPRITASPTPLIVGRSEQTAFGTTVTVNLYDLATDPGLQAPIGTGQTDVNGVFQIRVRPGVYTTSGLRTIAIRATDQSGTPGNVARLTFFFGTAYVPDLATDSDTGLPRPPRDTDNITNIPLSTFQGTLDPLATIQIFVGGLPAGIGQADAAGFFAITLTTPLAEGPNVVTMQETDAAGNVGPISPVLTVRLDTSPPPILPNPVLVPPSDTPAPGQVDYVPGVTDADRITFDATPTFTGTAEVSPYLSDFGTTATPPRAGALVQLFAQELSAPGQPTNPIVLVGEALADPVTGAYAVTVGQYVNPQPPGAVTFLADAQYNITVTQLDIAGNLSRTQVFGNSGAVVIDGTDANDHGGRDFQTGANTGGWFYMQQVLENIQPNVSNGNLLLVSVGANAANLTPTSGSGSAAAIASAFAQSPLPGLGWTIAFVEGPADIEAYLSGQAAVARDQNGQVIAGGVRLTQTGILYLTTANNASGDLSSSGVAPFAGGELGVVNAHGIDIANFVNAGGGLFAQAESPFSFRGTVVPPFGWLQSIFPTIGVGNPTTTGPNAIIITPVGMAAFPGLTVADLSTGPWHNTFGGLPGPDGVVGTVDDDFTPLAVAVTDLNGFAGSPTAQRINLILTSAGGGAPTTALVVTIDTTPPVAAPAPDLQAASDNGISNADNLTNFNNAAAAPGNAPAFDVAVAPFPAGEGIATVQLFRAPVVGGVAGAPALVNTRFGQVAGTVTIADINQADPTLQVPGPPIPDGTYVYTYRVIDQAGNIGAMSPGLTVTIETVAPVVGPPDLTDASDTGRPRPPRDTDDITNIPTPAFAGTAEPGALIELFFGGVLAGSARADAAGVYLVTATSPLAEGANDVTVRETDIAGNVGPMSAPALVVTLDTVPPAPIAPDLADASDSGPSNADNVTNVNAPTFVGTAEPNALVQIFAQLIAAPGQPDNPIVLAGEAVADPVTGAYAVTVGVYVQPTPATTIATLADGSYNITALQIDVAGNISRAQVFGNAGAVVIDGTDANDHGNRGTDPTTGLPVNQGGWFYMQQVLENIQPNVSNGNRVLVSVGADPADLGFGFGSAPSIASAFALSPLPGLGWTIAFVEGPADIEAYLSGQAANARDANNQVIAGGVRLAQTGILYLTTANNAGGDLETFSFGGTGTQFPGGELGVVNAHGIDIANFVNGGGGLFAQAESPFSFGGAVVPPFGWLQSIFPTIGVGNPTTTGPNDIQITPAGAAAFPGLTVADLSTGPWHNFFTALPGPDGVVGTVDDDFTPLAVAVTDLDEFPFPNQTPPPVRRNLILTAAGGAPTTALVVTIDTAAPATPTGLDLVDASDSFFNVTDPAGTHVVGSNADDYTNVTNPTFSVGGLEPGTNVGLLRDGVLVFGQVVPGAPGSGPQTLTLTDPGAVPAGVHTYQVQQRDLAGNPSGLSATLTVRFDLSVPAVPSAPRLLAADDSGTRGDNLTNVPRPRLTGTAALAVGEVPPTIQLVDPAGTIIGEGAAGANGVYVVTLNVAVIPNSVNFYTVRARAVDQAGNVSALSGSYTLTIDTRIPGAPTPPTLALSPADDSGIPGDNVTNVRQPNLIGRTGPNLMVDLLLVGAATPLVAGVRTAADGSFQVRFPAALADGTYRVQARVYDVAANEAFSPVLTLTIDTTAPVAAPGLRLAEASDTGIRGDGRTSLRRPLLVGAAGVAVEPGTRVEIVDAAGNVMNVPDNPVNTRLRLDGTFETQTALELVNGTIVLRARLRDAAGNIGPVGGVPLVLTITTADGDFDADGRADLAVYLQNAPAPGFSQWAIARSSVGLQLATFGGSGDTPLQGDFDGDGVNDLAVFRVATSEWFIVNLPRGTFRAVQFGPAGASLPVPADYDGDGRADIAVYVPATVPGTTSTWFISSSRDGLTRAISFGGGGYQPVPADYDGDGLTDIAVYLPASAASFGQWFVQGSRLGFARVTFGGGGHQPVPADYDGDGLTDIAVYQPASAASFAQWFVLGSRLGFAQVPFGGVGHVPVPRDYDGDGLTDLGVYEPSTARWFLLTGGGRSFNAPQFGAPGSLPVPAPLPYRLVAPAPPAARSLAAAPPSGSTVRAASAVTAAPAAPPSTSSAGGGRLDFGQTAVQLASRSARKAASVRARRRPPAQAVADLRAAALEARTARRRAHRPAAGSRG
jgi:subtilisin-like proprotein convertase family protein